MVDFTNLDKAVNNLMSPKICLTYIVPKPTTDNAYPIPDVSLDSNLNTLAISPCLEHAGVPTRHYQSLFDRNPGARPDRIAQVMLYQHLVKFFLACEFVSGKDGNDESNGKRIIALAVNFAFKTCIQEDTDGFLCGRERGPLEGQIGSGGNRQKLYSCISTRWLDQLGTYDPKECKGDPKNQLDIGLRMAIDSGATVGFPRWDTFKASWLSLLGSWNMAIPIGYDVDGTHPMCSVPTEITEQSICVLPNHGKVLSV